MKRTGIGLLCTALVACGGSDGDSSEPTISRGRDSVEATIDKRGGSLELENAARLTIPSDALADATDIRARRADLGALPRVGGDFEVVGQPLELTPHGLRLNRPATVEQTLDDDDVPASEIRVLRLADEDDTSWEPLRQDGIEVLEAEERSEDRDLQDDTVSDKRRVRFDVEGFSYYLPVRFVPNGLCAGAEEGTVCRDAAGPCDAAETCDGQSDDCPADMKLNAQTVCRASEDACDAAETCDGASDTCPDDGVRGAGSVCRPAEDESCDLAEVCDGESKACPEDAVVEQGVECRGVQGVCDVAETCDGESGRCPPDRFASSDTVCDEGTQCSLPASCSGEAADCPLNLPAPQGEECDDQRFCTLADACDGLGNCVGTGDPCSASIGDGDADCSESCQEGTQGPECTGNDPAGTACAPQACSVGTCNGSGACDEEVACPVFVDVNAELSADGDGCGTGWGDEACRSVQGGSDEAVRTSNPRVFVASGTYTNGSGTTVLSMADGVEYYGGFNGELRPEERALTQGSYSVLDGQAPWYENVPAVVGASDARLDGFVITRGGAPRGAGMYNDGVQNLTVSNVEFTDNYAYGYSGQAVRGAAMYNQDTDGLAVDNARFSGNRATSASQSAQGGAVYNQGVLNATFTNVSFSDNYVSGEASAHGGAMYSTSSTNLRLSGGLFELNYVQGRYDETASYSGGAMTTVAGTQTLVDVEFRENYVEGYGSIAGGALRSSDTDDDLTRVVFEDNYVDDVEGSDSGRGGAYAVQSTGPVQTSLADVVFIGNNVQVGAYGGGAEGGGLYVGHGSSSSTLDIQGATFLRNAVSNNSGTALGGGAAVQGPGSAVTLGDVQLVGNTVSGYGNSGDVLAGGGLYIDGNSVQLEDSDLIGNTVFGGFVVGGLGGGFYHGGAGELTVTNVGFVDNTAEQMSSGSGGNQGGALYVADGADYTLTNLSVVGNQPLVSTLHAASAAGTGQAYNLVLDGEFGGAAPAEVATCTVLRADYEMSADGHVYLTGEGTADCNTGDDVQADAAFSVDWRTLTTRLDGTLDTTPVDQGRHYDPSALRIVSFSAPSGSSVQWTVTAPPGTSCTLTDSMGSVELEASEIASGSATVEVSSEVILSCRDGGQLVEARAFPVAG